MLKPKKLPLRMCVGCREMLPKKELMRIVRSPEGRVAFDPVGKAPGRGAYLCQNPECLKKAVKSRALERQLACEITQDVYERLAQQQAEGSS